MIISLLLVTSRLKRTGNFFSSSFLSSFSRNLYANHGSPVKALGNDDIFIGICP